MVTKNAVFMRSVAFRKRLINIEGKEVCIMKKQLKKKVTVASKQHVMAHCSCTCSCSLNNNYNASWGKVNYHYI